MFFRITMPSLLFGLIFLIPFNGYAQYSKKDFVVVLDAGHGGADPGKVSGKFKEKDIALEIALETGKLLEFVDGIKVIYTRKKDVFVNLYKRGEIANKAHADLFVSIHTNAHQSNAEGVETYVLGLHANKQNFEVAKAENEVIYLEDSYQDHYIDYKIDSPESIIGVTIAQEEHLEQSVYLATLIQDYFTEKLSRTNRGVKQAGFIVLHQTIMPSVLVELGFITNSKERQFLVSQKGKKLMASGLKDAIVNYKKYIDVNGSFFTNGDLESQPPPPVTLPVKRKPPQKAVEEDIEDNIKMVEDYFKNQGTSQQTNTDSDALVYKVQIMALKRQISPVRANFKGLDVEVEKYNELYRYIFGRTKSYAEAKKLKAQATSKGYQGCFIVAYKGSKRLTIREAIKLQVQK